MPTTFHSTTTSAPPIAIRSPSILMWRSPVRLRKCVSSMNAMLVSAIATANTSHFTHSSGSSATCGTFG